MRPSTCLYLALASVLLVSSVARAETPGIAVLPIRASMPPTSDPTLLRLTEEVGRALHGAVGGDVRVVSRELRDETCPSTQGECPNDIASLLRADQVVSSWLDDSHERLTLRVYRALEGLERTLEVPCTRSGAKLSCDAKPIASKLLRRRETKLAAEQVERAFATLSARLEACLGPKAKAPSAQAPQKAEVSFQLDARGRPAHVRIEPRRVQAQRPYQCMARVVEDLALKGDGRALGSFRFSLPGSAPSSP